MGVSVGFPNLACGEAAQRVALPRWSGCPVTQWGPKRTQPARWTPRKRC